MQVLFLKSLFFQVSFSRIFAVANQLPGFSITRSANEEDFFNVNILIKIKYKFKYKRVVCYLKLTFSVTDFRDFNS